MSDIDIDALREKIRAEVEAEMKIRAELEAENKAPEHPPGGEFRYLGVSVMGETEDSNGNIVPNVVKSTELSGFKFSEKVYTEVPGDVVAYYADVLDRATRTRTPQPVYLVDKLRANSHFEERNAG